MKVKALHEHDFLENHTEYLVMGAFLGSNFINYLIGEETRVRTFTHELFEIVDPRIPSNWFFKAYTVNEEEYIYRDAVFGYYELCFDEQHYPNLVEREPAAMQLYFQRKLETEKCLNEWAALSAQNTKEQEQSQKKYSVTISENQILDFQRRSHIAEIWDHDRIIATVAQNYTHNTFDVEMYPPLHSPLLLDYLAFEQAMQRARIQLILSH